MKRHTYATIMIGGFALTAVAACNLPNLNDIALSDCIDVCTASTDETCKEDHAEAQCLADVEACFDSAADCPDACKDCELKGTCTSEDDCERECVHQAQGCTDKIRPCLRDQVDVVVDDLVDECVHPLLDCISGCIAEVERQLRGH